MNKKTTSADMTNDITKRTHMGIEMRKIIQRRWNENLDSKNHITIRQLAKELAMPESTLRYELKRGCEGNQSSFWLPDKKCYIYFRYDAKRAQENATFNAAQKGPRSKVITTFAKLFSNYLEEWHSIPAARTKMLEENPDLKDIIPSQRTIYNHATTTLSKAINISRYYAPYKKKATFYPPRRPRNHEPKRTIEELPETLKKAPPISYFQMDTVCSGAKGKGGLLILLSVGDPSIVFIRKLADLSQHSIHRSLRSIMNEAKVMNIQISHILTDNGSEFLEIKKIEKITGAKLYYTHAYCSWEKGSVENCNKIIRRWFPKGTDFSKIKHAEIKNLEDKLRNYPRPSYTKGHIYENSTTIPPVTA